MRYPDRNFTTRSTDHTTSGRVTVEQRHAKNPAIEKSHLSVCFLNVHLLSGDHLARVGLSTALVSDSAGAGVVVGRARNLSCQLLERLPLRLRDQQRGEETAEHEKGKDFHDVVEPWRGVGRGGVAPDTQGSEDNLGDDGADLTGGGRETVRCGTVARGETFAGYDEGGCVGTWGDALVNWHSEDRHGWIDYLPKLKKNWQRT